MVAERRAATFDDLMNMPDDGRSYELIDGEIRAAPAPSPRHQQVSTILTHSLESWVSETGLGLVFAAPSDVMLDPGVVVQPDLFYVAHDNPGEWVETVFRGTPDLVIEILSPSSITRDFMTKGQRYLRAGVREYWIVGDDAGSSDAAEAIDGMWVLREPDADGLVSAVTLPGFRIDLATLFAQADRRLNARRQR